MNRTNMAALTFLLASISAASADGCHIDKFDTTLPRARSGNVADPSANFTFASDIDDLGDGRVRIWNYINNTDSTNALSASWPKANVTIPYFRPLPAGTAYCNWVEAENLDTIKLDDDAPITYGNTNSIQMATVYKDNGHKEASGSSYFSSITSAYEKNGKIQTVDIQFIYFVNKDNRVEMNLLSPEDVYVAIARAPFIWSKSTIVSFWDTAKSQSSEATISNWEQFVAKSPEGLDFITADAFKNEALLISKGTIKGFSGAEIYRGAETTPVVVFDENKVPLFSGYLSIPVTFQQ
jgi:hypothetical protein